ncbi:MAG: glycine oxidase ThiO [Candidatus Acidiferrum sp.]
MTLADIAVVGGGLLGRSLAWRAARAGARVALYDAAGTKGEDSAAWAAAGMIAPTTEAIDADVQIASMGKHSLTLWPQWLADLPVPVFYRDSGTILLWHREDSSEAVRAEQRLASRVPQAGWKPLENSQLRQLEPALNSRLSHAAYIWGEAQIDNREFLEAVALALEETRVECHWNTFVSDHALPDAGIVVDCRGVGAKHDWRNLRGVRGEIVRLHAPDIELKHMLRLLHPRYPVYIVPRAEGRLVVGATAIESDDRSPVSVRGALELLTSAHSVLPALAEARILEFNTQVRPALPDNLPAIRFDRERRILRINGLYRHGFLLTPAVVEDVLVQLSLQAPTRVESWASLQYHDEVSECLFS